MGDVENWIKIKSIGIPKKHWGAANMHFCDGDDKYAYDIIRSFACYPDKVRDNGYGLFIHGDYGTGKTHAACYCLIQAMYRLFEYDTDAKFDGGCFFVSAADYVQSVLQKDHDVIRRAEMAKVLVLDDLGKESRNYTNESGWAISVLVNLVKKRSEQMQHTIATTNLMPDEVISRYSEYLEEAIRDNMVHIVLRVIKRSDESLSGYVVSALDSGENNGS
jgi:DNA replication protein DnaC